MSEAVDRAVALLDAAAEELRRVSTGWYGPMMRASVPTRSAPTINTVAGPLALWLKSAAVDAPLVGPDPSAIAVAEAVTGTKWPDRERTVEDIEAEHFGASDPPPDPYVPVDDGTPRVAERS